MSEKKDSDERGQIEEAMVKVGPGFMGKWSAHLE